MIGLLGVGGHEVPNQTPQGIISTMLTLVVLLVVCWLGIIAAVAVLEVRDRYRRRRTANDGRASRGSDQRKGHNDTGKSERTPRTA
jgi:hypothetical protein